jgi:hypothetical protein
MKFAGYFLNRKIRTLSKTSGSRIRRYRSLEDLRTVTILCNYRDWEIVNACIRTLKAMGKTVQACIYLEKQSDMPIWDYGYLLVDAVRDVDFRGFPKPDIRRQFNSISTDMLLDLTGDKCPVMRYLMLQHPAAFKVGAKHARETDDVYDFSILLKDNVQDIPFAFRQIMNYLRVIRSNGTKNHTK